VLVLVGASVNAQQSPTEDAKRLIDLFEKKEYKTTISEAESFIRNYPESPNIKSAILLIARSYYFLGKASDSMKYYKNLKEVTNDPDFIEEANKLISEIAEKENQQSKNQSNNSDIAALGTSIEPFIKRYGQAINQKTKKSREKSIVSLGISELKRNPEYVYDPVYQFKLKNNETPEGHVLITCGLLDNKISFLQYENFNNEFYPGKESDFDREGILRLMSINSSGVGFSSSSSNNEDSRFTYYRESDTGRIAFTQESTATGRSSHFVAFFTDDGFQAYLKLKQAQNSRELQGL